MNLDANKNTFWASIFVDELVNCGLENVCIAAGSRSTPLTLAFINTTGLNCYSHIDERSAGFFALGIAMTTKKPVVLLCTSGTAAANFHPAILEAFYSKIPLIILTADRPHELRDFGANQTMDQIKLYGDHVKWFVDVAPPVDNPTTDQINYVKTLASKSYAHSVFLPAGPIHLNFPFSKPLEPNSIPHKSKSNESPSIPYVTVSQGILFPNKTQIDEFISQVESNPKGLIVCGPRSSNEKITDLITKFSNLVGYPIFADIASNQRFGSHIRDDSLIITSYETFLKKNNIQTPQLVLQFGALPTSTYLQLYLQEMNDSVKIIINENNEWTDPSKTSNYMINCNPKELIRQALEILENRKIVRDNEWVNYWRELDNEIWKRIREVNEKEFYEGSILTEIFMQFPEDTLVFIANSLSIRHADQFIKPLSKKITVFTNRGLSGIDGTLSTALGIAAASDKKIMLITGDLALFHDLNGFMSIHRYNMQIVVILLNNQVGGIFERLPIAKSVDEATFKEFFLTHHNINFSSLVKMYGENKLEHKLIFTREDLFAEINKAFSSNISNILEFKIDYKKSNEIIDSII